MFKIRRSGSPGTFSSVATCLACLFTNQSITCCFPFVITRDSSAPVPSALQFQAEERMGGRKKRRQGETLTRVRRSDSDEMSPEGRCRCYLPNGRLFLSP